MLQSTQLHTATDVDKAANVDVVMYGNVLHVGGDEYHTSSGTT